jgi:hypothetical protein
MAQPGQCWCDCLRLPFLHSVNPRTRNTHRQRYGRRATEGIIIGANNPAPIPPQPSPRRSTLHLRTQGSERTDGRINAQAPMTPPDRAPLNLNTSDDDINDDDFFDDNIDYDFGGRYVDTLVLY